MAGSCFRYALRSIGTAPLTRAHRLEVGGAPDCDLGPQGRTTPTYRPYSAVSVADASLFAFRLNPTIAAVAFAGTSSFSVFSANTVNT